MSYPNIPSRGAAWPRGSLIWGESAGRGAVNRQYSPLDGSLVQETQLLDESELEVLVRPSEVLPHLDNATLRLWCEKLYQVLHGMRDDLLETRQWESGFPRADCRELVEGSLAYVQGFPALLESVAASPAPVVYEADGQQRQIRLDSRAWGTIALILPQNAPLLIGLTGMLNAVAIGNRIILRAPQQCARSAGLLAHALRTAPPPDPAVSVVAAPARDFTGALYRSSLPCLVHFMGSSRHAASLLAESFEHGKPALVDGEGNVWTWIEAEADAEAIARTLLRGALRYNGQSCTSINGAVIHPDLYPAVRERLLEEWRRLKIGDPLDERMDIGPLLDEKQAAWCEARVNQSGGTLLHGGERRDNWLPPMLVEEPEWESELVREGIFGPVLWIRAATRDEFIARWPSNRFPLCAGVLASDADAAWWLSQLPGLARLVVNGDPSVEDIFEPWGGYPASGANPVSTWLTKYQRVVAVDEPLSTA